MQLIPLTEEGKAMLAEAAAAERQRMLKYQRARRAVLLLPVFIADLRAATLYAKLEAHGYVWNAETCQWGKQQEQPFYNVSDLIADLQAGKFAGEGEDTEAQKQTAAHL